ncbi:hypothetical protein ACFOG5_20855 [Pedobacter fastidiosus]|uniref:hypothetical protein n=1 Tax=Pedobacter fastidiosus TaxID=2765361 RepID=UPI0036193179
MVSRFSEWRGLLSHMDTDFCIKIASCLAMTNFLSKALKNKPILDKPYSSVSYFLRFREWSSS